MRIVLLLVVGVAMASLAELFAARPDLKDLEWRQPQNRTTGMYDSDGNPIMGAPDQNAAYQALGNGGSWVFDPSTGSVNFVPFRPDSPDNFLPALGEAAALSAGFTLGAPALENALTAGSASLPPLQYADASGALGTMTDAPVYDTLAQADPMAAWDAAAGGASSGYAPLDLTAPAVGAGALGAGAAAAKGLGGGGPTTASASGALDTAAKAGTAATGAAAVGNAVSGDGGLSPTDMQQSDTDILNRAMKDNPDVVPGDPGLVSYIKNLGTGTLTALGMMNKDGSINWGKALAAGGLLAGVYEATKPKTSSTTTTLPEWYTRGSQSALGIADKYAATPFEPYTGERVAPLSANERQAVDLASADANRWTPMVDEAGNLIKQGATPVTEADIARYMNPYVDMALSPAARQLQLQLAKEKQAREASAGRVGAFGGTRLAVENSLGAERGLYALNDLYGTGYKNAFDTATGLATGEKNRSITAGGALSSTASTGSGLTDASTRRLAATGALDRGVNQAKNDFNFEQYQDRLKQPLKQIDAYAGALRGNPGSTTTSTAAPPSLVGQAAGALGAYQAITKPGGALDWFGEK